MVRKRSKFSRKKVLRPDSQLPGQSPGTLTADPEAASTRIDIIRFNATECEHIEHATIEDIKKTSDQHINWINVTGLADISAIESFGEIFHLDRLLLEDIVSGSQLPKMEVLDDLDFVVMRKAVYEKGFDTRQVAIVTGPKIVLTFHERSSIYLNPVRERILKAQGKIRKSGTDYLSYAIVDCIVDHYFPALTKFAEVFTDLEDLVYTATNSDFIAQIRELRTNLVKFQSVTLSTRDVLNRLIANPSNRLAHTTRPFLRDCLDHVLQINDQLDSFKLTSSDLMNQYHSNMTQKLNESMKVLTIISTIFIPLTFITSIYGMNFDGKISAYNMPELTHPYGYPAVIILMAVVAFVMILWIRKKGWLTNGDH